MYAVIPVIMGAWVVFALWLVRDGLRHLRWAARLDRPDDHDRHDDRPDHRTDGPGDEVVSHGHGVLLATVRFAAAIGLLALVAATVYGADLLWLALGPPVVIVAAGLAGHVGTRWLVRGSDPADGSLPEGS